MATVVKDDSNSIANSPPVPPRNDLVKTAVQFLQSPKVYNTPNHLKIAFLKKKGLSDAEIELSMKQAEEIIKSRAPLSIPIDIPSPPLQVVPYMQPWSLQPRWMKYRDILNGVALLGGIAYAVYWFYKKYVVPYLFGRRSRKTIEVRLIELEKTVIDCVGEIKINMNKMREDLERMAERRGDGVNKQIEELKAEVTTLKKLLLNRKQFPTATVTGPLAIPSWQRASSPPEEKENLEEEGNGSNTNGSDSSLEMIKE